MLTSNAVNQLIVSVQAGKTPALSDVKSLLESHVQATKQWSCSSCRFFNSSNSTCKQRKGIMKAIHRTEKGCALWSLS